MNTQMNDAKSRADRSDPIIGITLSAERSEAFPGYYTVVVQATIVGNEGETFSGMAWCDLYSNGTKITLLPVQLAPLPTQHTYGITLTLISPKPDTAVVTGSFLQTPAPFPTVFTISSQTDVVDADADAQTKENTQRSTHFEASATYTYNERDNPQMVSVSLLIDTPSEVLTRPMVSLRSGRFEIGSGRLCQSRDKFHGRISIDDPHASVADLTSVVVLVQRRDGGSREFVAQKC